MTVGERIKQRRLELGLTQEELAKRLGYTSRTAISNVEKGKEDLTTTRCKKFADALETTPAYLMGWNENPKPIPVDLVIPYMEEMNKITGASFDKRIALYMQLISAAKDSKPEDIKMATDLLNRLNRKDDKNETT